MVQTFRTLLNIVVSLQIPGRILCVVSGLTCAAYLFSSCNGAANSKPANTDSIIQLPAPTVLSKAEIEKYRRACEAWYDTSLKARGFNGGIIVAKKGNVVFEDYMGTAHLNGTDTVTANTALHIASVSKTFTAMAVLKLAQDGKLNIDDEFVKYFPNFNYPGVTIRSLLNHRSGLPNYVHFMEQLKWNKKQYVLNEDVLDYLITRKASLKDIARPNTRFSYCNSNYALLALLIEKLSGMKYALFMQQTFFKPLQMQNTFVFDTSMLQKVIPSYDWKGELIPYNFLDAVYGDKNIYSTARDLLIWDKALNCCKIFKDSTLMEAFAPYSNEKPGIKNYGLGWRMNIYPNGKKMIYHNGWWHGNNAAFIRLIEDSATIIVVGNKFNRNIYHAREMVPIFGDFGDIAPEEEEHPSSKKDPAPSISPGNQSKKGKRK
ncbi:MAG: serine hydrolase domain-containing protein [Bacteroidota bacterium]